MKFAWLHDRKNSQKWQWVAGCLHQPIGMHWYLTDPPVIDGSNDPGIPGALGANFATALSSACTILNGAGVSSHFNGIVPGSPNRAGWTQQAIQYLSGCQAVLLLDPDTGIAFGQTVTRGHTLPTEIAQFAQSFRRGSRLSTPNSAYRGSRTDGNNFCPFRLWQNDQLSACNEQCLSGDSELTRLIASASNAVKGLAMSATGPPSGHPQSTPW